MTPLGSCSEARAFVIAKADNVATLLADVPAVTKIRLLGETEGESTVAAASDIPAAHKVALRAIAAGESVIKYGHRIGHATRDIAAGEWVHLHNCGSDVDERSNTLDVHTGAPSDTDTAYE